MERLHIKIMGRVQGVFFRAHTQEEAIRLGLTGWVKNTADGGVEIIAEGEKSSLEIFISWCRIGPPAAKVASLSVEWLPATQEFSGFGII